MEKDELIKKENGHDISIALIQRDIQYIKESVSGIGMQIAVMDKNFVKREEVQQIAKVLEDMTKLLKEKADHGDLKLLGDLMKEKVNKSEFDPIAKTLSKINWMFISAIVIGILALLIK